MRDCLETMKRMKDKSVKLIIVDFPYYMTNKRLASATIVKEKSEKMELF